jgi:hypothetical protein
MRVAAGRAHTDTKRLRFPEFSFPEFSGYKTPSRTRISEQNQNQKDDEDRAKAAGRVQSPSGAVWPGRQRADEENDDDNEKDKAHWTPA